MKAHKTQVIPIIGSTKPLELANWLKEHFEAKVTVTKDCVWVRLGEITGRYLVVAVKVNSPDVGVLEITLSTTYRSALLKKFKKYIKGKKSQEPLCSVYMAEECIGYVRFCFVP